MSASSLSLTVNSFPSLHAFSSRSWVLACIVLLHMGFFWALSNGLSTQIITQVRKSIFVPVPAPIVDPPKPTPIVINGPVVSGPVIKVPEPVGPVIDNPDAIRGEVIDKPSEPPTGSVTSPRETLVVQPRAAAGGLTEPQYPPTAIRLNQTGTVLLSVQILENGRVGDVRVEQSSGYAALDKAAVSQAREWRFIAGTHDGVPMVMWKQIPITFKLKN